MSINCSKSKKEELLCSSSAYFTKDLQAELLRKEVSNKFPES